MNTMSTIEPPRLEKKEALKDIIDTISAINNEINAQLQMIADGLYNGPTPKNNCKNPDDPLPIMDSIRHERDKTGENLKLLTNIREHLW